MTKSKHIALFGAVLVALMVAGACSEAAPPASMTASPVRLNAGESQAVEGFEVNLANYLSLHRRLESGLPALSNMATPDQIAKNQRALSALIRTARPEAKQGDFFTPAMQALVDRALTSALAGSGNKASLDSIMDDNPVLPGLAVNDRYPEMLPLSTMPLEVLRALPRLGDGLEYRFAGERLILMDTHANLIIDFTDNVLP